MPKYQKPETGLAARKRAARLQAAAITRRRREYRLLEWVVALSGDFFADKRYKNWQDGFNNWAEGCSGIWSWLIGLAKAANSVTRDINFNATTVAFYDLVEAVVDVLYGPLYPWELSDDHIKKVITDFIDRKPKSDVKHEDNAAQCQLPQRRPRHRKARNR